MLLIYPPVAKPCEPPAGIARLAGVLRGNGLEATLLDANLEGLLFLLGSAPTPDDTWSRRAGKNVAANLAALRRPATYRNRDRYQRAVADVNRVLEMVGQARDIALSLANYQDPALSPLKSADLLQAARQYADNLFFAYFSQRLAQLLADKKPALVGISLNYLSQALTTFAMVGFLKANYPGLQVVLGGGLVTSWLRNPAWRNPFGGLVDHLVAGPGEAGLLDLLGAAGARQDHPPSYQDLPLADYLAPGFILPYAASAGCYWNRCSFCPERAEDNPYLPMADERVVAEVARLSRQTRPAMLHFLDNAVRPSLMQALVEQPPGIPWYGFARVGPKLTDPDFCMALRNSGCVLLKLGIESGDQAVLDAMDKGIDLEMVSRALTNLRDAGIGTYVYLLFGTPAETIAAARRTLEFVVRHENAITFLNLAIFNMPVAGPEAGALATGDFYEGDLSLYTDFHHPEGWSRHGVRQFLDREFKRHPVVAAILRRDPAIFTSNHAPFFIDCYDIAADPLLTG